MKHQRTALGLAGSLLVLGGLFAPFISLPMVGSMTYMQLGQEAYLLLALALLSLLLTLVRRYRGLVVTGTACLVVVLIRVVTFQVRMAEAEREMSAELSDNPFKGLAEMAVAAVQLQWGWVVVLSGAILLILAATVRSESSQVSEEAKTLSVTVSRTPLTTSDQVHL